MAKPTWLAHPRNDTATVPATYRDGTTERFVGAQCAAPCHTAVAVVGAGITGISTALALAEHGVEVVVLEASHVGAGASGRAFGQVMSYGKHDQHWTWRRFGVDRGNELIDFFATGPSVVFSLIERYGIDCEAKNNGTVLAMHHPNAREHLLATAKYWASRGAPVEILTGTELATLIGSDRYELAMLDRRNGTLNVFGYVQGMARAAATAGATVIEQCPVESIVREGNAWLLKTHLGEVRAENIVLATNAFSDSPWPALGRSIVPFRGYGLVTAPIEPALRHDILPGGQSLFDTRRLFSGLRLRPDGRMNVSTDGPPFRIGNAHRDKARRRLLSTYPQLESVEWEEEWAGWIAITASQFPGLHPIGDRAWAALGYSGRGIALGTLLGREVAREIIGDRNRPSPFPITALRKLPSRLGAMAAGQALVSLYRILDRRELRATE